jgi:hypothetical protein
MDFVALLGLIAIFDLRLIDIHCFMASRKGYGDEETYFMAYLLVSWGKKALTACCTC